MVHSSGGDMVIANAIESSAMHYGMVNVLGKTYYLDQRSTNLSFIHTLSEIGRYTQDSSAVDAVYEAVTGDKSGILMRVSGQWNSLACSQSIICEDKRTISDVVKSAVKDVVEKMKNPELIKSLELLKGDYHAVNGLSHLGVNYEHDLVACVCKSINNVYERDPTTAKMIGRYAFLISNIFSDKYEGILGYIERRGDRESMIAISRIAATIKVADYIKGISVPSFSNKHSKKLIKLAAYLDNIYKLRLNIQASKDLSVAFADAESVLKSYMEGLGIKDMDKIMKFFPWIMSKDQTALSVLRGESIEKSGMPRTYPLTNLDDAFNLENIRKEIQHYMGILGLGVPVEGDLFHLKRAAEYILVELIKLDFSSQKNISQELLGEIRPNLERILNLHSNGSENYVLSVNPSDLESQILSLQTVTSCMSPGGSNFRYTQAYLANPNTFWAVIKGKEDGKVVGDVTVFMGKHQRKKVIARVSKVYSLVPIDEEAIDAALITYAGEMKAEFIESGEMFVKGLEDAKEDFVTGEKGKMVVDKTKTAW